MDSGCPRNLKPDRRKKPQPRRVKRILAEVRAKGDKALFTYTRKLDGVELKLIGGK